MINDIQFTYSLKKRSLPIENFDKNNPYGYGLLADECLIQAFGLIADPEILLA